MPLVRINARLRGSRVAFLGWLARDSIGSVKEMGLDWITERIAIGNIEDALNHERLVEQRISGILCLNGFPSFTAHLGVFDWRLVLFIDGPGNPPELLGQALTTLRELMLAHNRVLVHCAEGVSRSPFVVASYLAEENGQDLATAVRWVTQRRGDTSISSSLIPLWDEYQRLRQGGTI